MTWAVRSEGLRKTFRIRAPGPDGSRVTVDHEALRGIDLEVSRGEVLGIVGRNGAGKSTLLKILARILVPTAGSAAVRGRVASLLEVGTGMHPEMSGRENVYLNGAILGMTRAEIRRREGEILEFSGVGEYADTPLKHYSSGMRLRLAFSVAAFLSAEVLIVDEVLAVGDAEFQQRCVNTMREGMSGGRTTLFVSHNMLAIRAVCSRCIWIRDGVVHADGPPAAVSTRYLEGFSSGNPQCTFPPPPGPGSPHLVRAGASAPSGGSIAVDTGCEIAVRFRNPRPGAGLHVTLHVLASDGVCAFSTASLPAEGGAAPPLDAGEHEAVVRIPPWLLNAGRYPVTVLLVEDGTRVLQEAPHALVLTVEDVVGDRGGWYGSWPGVVRPRLPWSVRSAGSAPPP